MTEKDSSFYCHLSDIQKSNISGTLMMRKDLYCPKRFERSYLKKGTKPKYMTYTSLMPFHIIWTTGANLLTH